MWERCTRRMKGNTGERGTSAMIHTTDKGVTTKGGKDKAHETPTPADDTTDQKNTIEKTDPPPDATDRNTTKHRKYPIINPMHSHKNPTK